MGEVRGTGRRKTGRVISIGWRKMVWGTGNREGETDGKGGWR